MTDPLKLAEVDLSKIWDRVCGTNLSGSLKDQLHSVLFELGRLRTLDARVGELERERDRLDRQLTVEFLTGIRCQSCDTLTQQLRVAKADVSEAIRLMERLILQPVNDEDIAWAKQKLKELKSLEQMKKG